jgi:hypothetical protein
VYLLRVVCTETTMVTNVHRQLFDSLMYVFDRHCQQIVKVNGEGGKIQGGHALPGISSLV